MFEMSQIIFLNLNIQPTGYFKISYRIKSRFLLFDFLFKINFYTPPKKFFTKKGLNLEIRPPPSKQNTIFEN